MKSDADKCFCKRADVYADVYLPVQSDSRVGPPLRAVDGLPALERC